MKNGRDPHPTQGNDPADAKRIERQKRARSPNDRLSHSAKCKKQVTQPVNRSEHAGPGPGADSYALLRTLEETIFGFTCIAKRRSDDQLVVIKISELDRPISTREDPLHEARILRELGRGRDCEGKRYVCRMIDSFHWRPNSQEADVNDNDTGASQPSSSIKSEKDGQPKPLPGLWTILEFANGGEMFNLVKCKSQLFSPKIVRRLFRQIVLGVQYMHSCGYAHLDLSLENVLISLPRGATDLSDAEVKIIDFGMALKHANVDSKKLRWRGKPYSMAPELYHGTGIDAKAADLYSLGVILFAIATGGPAYLEVDDKAFKYVWMGRQGIEKLLDMWQKSVDPDALDLICKLMCRVEDRYTMFNLLQHRYLRTPDD
mmetsp:Transcript_17160/g.42094  ORF Transcript_17160/g.42094 Transcript_17160/m.42094 type:complete len:374 (-) Transcript_17160:934-2055(-)